MVITYIETTDKYVKQLEKEVETLKKQNGFLMKRENKLQVLETKEKEFIKWLELNWKETQDVWFVKIINKYKKIIGVDCDD